MHTPLVDPGPDPHPYGEVLGVVELLERRQREMDAARVMLIAAALEQAVGDTGSGGNREIAYRALRAELAAALGQSEHLVERQMSLAHSLTSDYRAVHEALDRGEIAYAHARVIVDAGAVVGPGDAPQTVARRDGYVREVLEVAVRETPNRLRPTARALAESWSETPVEERHHEARARRQVALVDEEDGMALLLARLPAVEAHAVFDRITRIAQACERGERVVRDLGGVRSPSVSPADSPYASPSGSDTLSGSTRTRDQLRADVLADLLLSSDERTLFAGDTAESIRARVQLVVPVGALRAEPGEHYAARHTDPAGPADSAGSAGPASHTDPAEDLADLADLADPRNSANPAAEPACELLGYGTIDRDSARRLAGVAAEWDRVGVEPVTGEVLEVERYRPSERMRRTLRARDRHCRFPGCRVPVSRCDLDHTVAAAEGGATATDNLAHLCRGHHVLKHHSEWRVVQQAGGELRWTSPAGRSYVDRPERFHRPRRPAPREKPPEPARSPLLRAVRAVRFAPVDDSVRAF